jgi:hypothetical protein
MSVDTQSPTQSLQLAGRLLTAAALGVMAGLHLHLYSTYGYKTIPTIGGLFLANGIAGSALAVAILLVPRRLLGLTAFVSADLLGGTLVGFLVALNRPLFGFQDSMSAPHAWACLIAEAAGTVTAIGLAALALRGSGLRAVVPLGPRA